MPHRVLCSAVTLLLLISSYALAQDDFRIVGEGGSVVDGFELRATGGFGGFALNDHGDVAFTSDIFALQETASDDRGLFVDSGGEVKLITRAGLAAPGTEAFFQSRSVEGPAFGGAGVTFFGLALANSGDLIVRADLRGPTVTDFLNSTAVFNFDSSGTGQLVARGAGPAPGGTGSIAVPFAFDISDSGEILLGYRFDPSGQLNLDANPFLLPQAIAVGPPGGLLPIVTSGSNSLQSDPLVELSSFSGILIGNDQVLLQASLAGPGVTNENRTTILRSDSSGISLVVRAGDPVPGISDAVFAGGPIFNFTGNSSGEVAFTANLMGPNVDETNDQALFSDVGGNGLQMVAREGQAQQGRFIIPSPFSNLSLANSGDLVFLQTEQTQSLVIRVRPDGEIQTLARGSGSVPNSLQDRQFSSFGQILADDRGQVFFQAFFSDLSDGLFVVDAQNQFSIVARSTISVDGEAVTISGSGILQNLTVAGSGVVAFQYPSAEGVFVSDRFASVVSDSLSADIEVGSRITQGVFSLTSTIDSESSGLPTEFRIIDSETVSGSVQVTADFISLSEAETSARFAGSNLDLLSGEIVELSGLDQLLHVIELTLNDNSENGDVLWLTEDGTNQWVNAILGNSNVSGFDADLLQNGDDGVILVDGIETNLLSYLDSQRFDGSYQDYLLTQDDQIPELGAFGSDGFRAWAVIDHNSAFAIGAVPSASLGDVNLDGSVDFLDIAPFIQLLVSGSGGFQTEADIDESGEVDFLDIAPFIGVLTGS